MEYKKFDNYYRIRIDRGEEIISSIRSFAQRENVLHAEVSGLGAVGHVIVGLYDTAAKKYIANTFSGDMEIISLTGSITEKDSEVYLHLHIGLSDVTGAVRGGHLTEAVVSGTCELFVSILPGNTGRKFDADIGLNLIDFEG